MPSPGPHRCLGAWVPPFNLRSSFFACFRLSMHNHATTTTSPESNPTQVQLNTEGCQHNVPPRPRRFFASLASLPPMPRNTAHFVNSYFFLEATTQQAKANSDGYRPASNLLKPRTQTGESEFGALTGQKRTAISQQIRMGIDRLETNSCFFLKPTAQQAKAPNAKQYSTMLFVVFDLASK